MDEDSKYIHQTWKTKDIPEVWKISAEKWKELYPDYTYKLWTDEDNLNFIKEEHPKYLDMYLNYKYNIQRADIIRYFILQKYGGIYSDLDIVPIKRIPDSILNADVLVMRGNTVNERFTNAFMISTKKNVPFWKYVINESEKKSKYVPWYRFGKHYNVVSTTGPVMFSNAVLNYEGSISLLPKSLSICDSCSKNGCKTRDESYITNLKGESWHGLDSIIFKRIKCNIKIIIFIILIAIIFHFYKFFTYKKCCLISNVGVN